MGLCDRQMYQLCLSLNYPSGESIRATVITLIACSWSRIDNYLYNNTLKSRDTCPANCVSRDTCPANCVSRDTCPANCVSRDACQANSVVQTVGGADEETVGGADEVHQSKRLLHFGDFRPIINSTLIVRRAASCAPTHLAAALLLLLPPTT